VNLREESQQCLLLNEGLECSTISSSSFPSKAALLGSSSELQGDPVEALTWPIQRQTHGMVASADLRIGAFKRFVPAH